MKRKFIPLLVAAMAVTTLLGGCGTNENSGSSSAEEENRTVKTREIIQMIGYKPSKYVKLMDGYDSLSVELTGDYDVTDESIQAYAESILASYPYYVEDKSDTTVDKGDIVNIDYTGTIDGEEFSGGSAEDQYLEIGSGSFIDGFESGLKGHKVGETVTLNLKFDDDYYDSDLAGQKVKFVVKINYIADQEDVTYDTLTDDYIAQNFSSSGITTVDDFKTQIQTSLESSEESQKSSDTQDAVLEKLIDGCEVTLPDGLLDERVQEAKDNLEEQAEAAGMEVADYLTNYYGMTEDEYDEQLESSYEESLKEELILQAIVQKDKITFETDDFYTFVDQYVSYYGTDRSTFFEEYGGKDRVMYSYAENLALQQCVEGASVTVKAADDEDSSSDDSSATVSESDDSSAAEE